MFYESHYFIIHKTNKTKHAKKLYMAKENNNIKLNHTEQTLIHAKHTLNTKQKRKQYAGRTPHSYRQMPCHR